MHLYFIYLSSIKKLNLNEENNVRYGIFVKWCKKMLKSLFLYSLLQQGPFLLRSDSDPEEKNVRLRPDPDPQH